MGSPAVLNLARKAQGLRRRRALGIGLVGLLGLTVGYIGQGSWGVGAATPTAVGAIVTDVVGGAGSRAPVRVRISLAVTNLGIDSVRVIEPDSTGDGTRVLGLSPTELDVDPGVIGRIDADATLDCQLPKPLLLPDLRLALRDGTRRELRIGGSGMLLEACSRAAPEVRPLAAELVGSSATSLPTPISTAVRTPSTTTTTTPTPTTSAVRTSSTIPVPTSTRSPAGSPAPAPTPTIGPVDGSLAVRLSSPTGRRIKVQLIRAGGVPLTMTPSSVTIAEKAKIVVHLKAPRTCPAEWQLAGLPSALTADLTPEPEDAGDLQDTSGAIVRLRLGPPLARWLLSTSCPGSPS